MPTKHVNGQPSSTTLKRKATHGDQSDMATTQIHTHVVELHNRRIKSPIAACEQ
jgi:hypothetical protein